MIYTLPNLNESRIVFSLKANSQLLQKLQNFHGTVEFDKYSARIVVDNCEFELKHSECNSTDSYRFTPSNSLEPIGSFVDRYKVVSNVTEKVSKPIPVLPKKRTAALINVENKTSSPQKILKVQRDNRNVSTSSTSVNKMHTAPTASTSSSTSVITHDVSWLIMSSVHLDVSIKDILTFFSGLTVQRIVIGLRTTKFRQSNHRVNVYIEFKTSSGCELALLRVNEPLRPQNSSSSSTGKSEVVNLSKITEEEIFWVKGVGFVVYDAVDESKQSSLSVSLNRRIEEFTSILPTGCVCLSLDPRLLCEKYHFMMRCLPQLYQPKTSSEVKNSIKRSKQPTNVESCYANISYLFNNANIENILDTHIGLFDEDSIDINDHEHNDCNLLDDLKSIQSHWKCSNTTSSYNTKGVSSPSEVITILKEVSTVYRSLLMKNFPSKTEDAGLTRSINHVSRVQQTLIILRIEMWRRVHVNRNKVNVDEADTTKL